MSLPTTQIENNDINEEEAMASKRSKLHPAPEDPETEINSKKRKTSKSSKTSNPEKENISVNREEGEVSEEKEVTQKDEKKIRGKSASKNKSASRSRSKARSKSRSNMKTRSKKYDDVTEENSAEDSSSYNLRPRKTVDYTVASPEDKKSGTGADSEKKEDNSDASFKVDDTQDMEGDHTEAQVQGEGQCEETNVPTEKESLLPESTETLQPSDQQNAEAAESDSSDEELDKVSPEELNLELKDLQGKFYWDCINFLYI